MSATDTHRPSSQLAWERLLAEVVIRRPYLAIACLLMAVLAVMAWRVGPANLFLTPDQRGQWLVQRGRYDEAASAFRDPMWLGAAQMKAKDFKAAAQTFCGFDTADANYNCGNALIMLGKYQDAIPRYDRALELNPSFAAAEANRTLAKLRAERLARQAGQESFDLDEPNPRDERPSMTGKVDRPDKEPPQAETGMSDEAVRALWLKRVQTRPADFLRARFAYQLQPPSPPSSGAPK
jgi:Ca-activated chloride channel family protein